MGRPIFTATYIGRLIREFQSCDGNVASWREFFIEVLFQYIDDMMHPTSDSAMASCWEMMLKEKSTVQVGNQTYLPWQLGADLLVRSMIGAEWRTPWYFYEFMAGALL